MRHSLSIGGSSSVQWRKVGRSWRLRMCFHRLLCVRIEIDQLKCVNCWVIIQCLSVSCTKINHSRCALVIWSSLQLTSKECIITQQFTAAANYLLNISFIYNRLFCCNHTCYCVNMVSVTSASLHIMSVSRYYPRPRCTPVALIPQNLAEFGRGSSDCKRPFRSI